jgi:hypothetical protein
MNTDDTSAAAPSNHVKYESLSVDGLNIAYRETGLRI